MQLGFLFPPYLDGARNLDLNIGQTRMCVSRLPSGVNTGIERGRGWYAEGHCPGSPAPGSRTERITGKTEKIVKPGDKSMRLVTGNHFFMPIQSHFNILLN